MSGADWAILAVVVVLFVLSIFFAAVGDRVHPDEPHPGDRARRGRQQARAPGSRDDARAARADAQRRAAHGAGRPAHRPRRSSVCCSKAPPACCGVVIGIVLQIVLFFVIGEVAPKTFAVQHTERAALALTPMLWFLTNFAPLRWLSNLLIGVANVVLPGKGLKQGPFVTEEEIRTMADVAARRGLHRARGTAAHPLDLRVRRHRRARGDAAAPRHGRGRRRRHHRRRDRARHRARVLAPPGVRGGLDRQHHRSRVPEGPRAPGPRR